MTAEASPAAPRAVMLPFGAIVLAMLPAVLDQTILAAALPTIASRLGALGDVSWVVTAYVVAAAAATPLWGKLGDRHGRRRLLMAALAAFATASALCGLAQGMRELIVFRGLQGVAAGGLMTLAMASVGDLVAPRERGRYQGYIAAAFAVATIVGPLLGGLLVEHASWRWVFYVNLPVGVIAFAGLGTLLPDPPRDDRRAGPLDVPGALLLAGATCTVMLACILGGDTWPWGSAQTAGLAAAAVVLAMALAVRERRAADPLVPVAMLTTRAVAVASGGMFLATAALMAVIVFIPLFLQVTTRATPTEAGLLLVPAMAGITVSTTVSGRLMERNGRYRHFPVIGLALMTAGLVVLAVVAGDPSRTATGAGLAVFGLGFGLVTQILVVAVQNGVEQRELGVATAATAFFRALGGAMGAAALGAVFAASAGRDVSGDPGRVTAAARAGVIDGTRAVLTVAVPLAVIGLLVVLRLPDAPLRRRQPQGSRPQPVPGRRG